MKFVLAVLSALALLSLGAPAHAASGTPAWSKQPLVLYQGPGKAYDVVGQIATETRITVNRCSAAWCHVHANGESGWASLYRIAFGVGPHTEGDLGYKGGGPGQVCLYEGRNFTGESFCMKPGFWTRDLLLRDLDNRFSSVSIEGDVSVDLCRDRGFKSYCERINESDAALHGFLDNNVSSVIVY